MRKLKVGAVLGALRQVASLQFLFAPGQAPWLLLAVAGNIIFLYAVQINGGAANGFFLLQTALMVPAIINTHRYLLLGERPTLRSSALTPGYLKASVQISLTFYLPAMAFIALPMLLARELPENGLAPAMPAMLLFGAIVTGLVLTYCTVLPMMLVLPARATGRHDLRFRDALTAAKGNIGRLLGTFLAGSVLLMLALAICLLFLILFASIMAAVLFPAQILLGAIIGVLDYAFTLGAAAMLSFAYAGLVQHDPRFVR